MQQLSARVLAFPAEARVRAPGGVCLSLVLYRTVEDEDDLGQVSPLNVIFLLTDKTKALLSIGFMLCKLR